MSINRCCLVIFIGLAGCTNAKSVATDYVEADLSGQIDGRDWFYKHAYTDPTIKTPNEDDVVFIFLPYIPKDKCPKSQDDASDHRSIMVAAPQQTKQVKIKAGTQRNLVFQYDDKTGDQVAKSAKKGKIKLLKITADKVVGKLFGRFSDTNWVSGNFTAIVCNSLDLR